MTASSPVDSERLVQVWLSVDDLELIERSLEQFASADASDHELQRHVAAVKKHFDWVRGEFITEPA